MKQNLVQLIAEIATRGRPTKHAAAVELGRLGGLKGGNARAAALTPGQRSAQASKAARVRWDPRPDISQNHPLILALRSHPGGLTQVQIAEVTGLSAEAVNSAVRNARRSGISVVRVGSAPRSGPGPKAAVYQLME